MGVRGRRASVLLALLTLGFLPGSSRAQTLTTFASARPTEPTEAKEERTHVQVFAKGDVKGVATGETSESTVGTGALGISLRNGRATFVGKLNVASSVDTLTESFGEILLNPNTGKALQSGLLDVWYAGWLEDKLGVTAFHHLGRGYIGETPISLTVEGGPSLRYLAGDVTNVPDDVRSAILGTTDRTFFGFEMGFSLVFGTLSGALHYYGFPGGDAPLVGLTSGQVTVGFQVAGHVLPGYLGDQPEAREREAAGAEIPVPGH